MLILILTHFKERVAIGLGLSPHHLGMTANGGNRSVTDRLGYSSYMIRLSYIKDILIRNHSDLRSLMNFF
jgi:hypothetical protein